jgi:hypothetical protein
MKRDQFVFKFGETRVKRGNKLTRWIARKAKLTSQGGRETSTKRNTVSATDEASVTGSEPWGAQWEVSGKWAVASRQ